MKATMAEKTPEAAQYYPGQDAGRPIDGPGAIARIPRRLFAFLIDWYLCYGLMMLTSWANDQLLIIVFFTLYQIVTVGFSGHTLGHLLLGMQVQTLDGQPVGYGRAAVRAILIALVIPVFVMDKDQRGMHDQARGSVLARIR
ncbi:RDD family protein [Rothia sp. ZJ1223]|nr:RDD family protein [Rothia sp. ZJ1223]